MLDGKVAVITGGSTGIGRASAVKYLEYGADVVIANRSSETGQATAKELGCDFVQCDVADYDQVKALVEATVEDYGRLDAMVNNAGIGRVGTVEEMALDDWHDVMRINLNGVMHGTRAALPHLKESEGSIVNIASIYGLVAGPSATAYAAAKGAIVNFTRSVAVDYAKQNVRVNSICPGFVETPMTDPAFGEEEFYEYVHGQTPMGRVAQPEEIAGLAMFLASDEASYITGANIPVDGGWTAQ
ncbi:SDR family NAD(P)-dependent oxidoreductase [Halorubrum sp. AD140]|uniref:SDR family NAD(P)-dependent oxidoreductase n=1 Tax=Halorubrum sp. AD140 TaxID=3050073 RepID=UPI002ACCAFAB|nr:SDR family NAD(P)-dependent oxidoreductase [Halorubrum sp. AD140]MDZ5811465.1 SDR family NAD(P)-dependent oxidoreductase [Halorubrum sp. AD140]